MKPARLSVADALALPALCGPTEIQRLWGISKGRFYALDKERAFDCLMVQPAIGPTRFSGVLIGRYLSGEPLYVPSFGRKQKVG